MFNVLSCLRAVFECGPVRRRTHLHDGLFAYRRTDQGTLPLMIQKHSTRRTTAHNTFFRVELFLYYRIKSGNRRAQFTVFV